VPVNTVNLISPGLFRAFHQSEITSDNIEGRLLQKLLARSSYLDQISINSFYDYLKKLPLARYECTASGLEINDHLSVIYAQPLHLELKTDHIVARLLEISGAELTRLVQLLNDFYKHAGIEFIQLASGKICCVFSDNKKVYFTPSTDVLGRDIKHFLPRGDDARYWVSLFNEIQMLLHENSTELQGGLASLNALWFWGSIQYAENSDLPEYIAGSSEWIKGMCMLDDISIVDIKELGTIETDSVTVFDEGFLTAAATGDFNKWINQLDHFEKHVLGPLHKQLMNKVVDRILLYDSPASAYELKRSDRFRFFRKTPSFKKICSAQ